MKNIAQTPNSYRVDNTLSPYPGLRPFKLEENHLFFGREGHENQMLDILRRHRFLAVTGASGSGKSSLVLCGLQSALLGGYLDPEISDLKIAIFRPGSDPIGNLSAQLIDLGIGTEGLKKSLRENSELLRQATNSNMRYNSFGLINSFRRACPAETTALVIVVDQFEELFRFQSSGAPTDDAAHFVQLLLTATDLEIAGIYVVITMRSDHLGSCTQFRGLPEKINQCQYLVPRLSREQLKAAIAGPARVAGTRISPLLMQRILLDVGQQPDHLPVMQHALMRTWENWKKDHEEGEPVDVRHYEAIGTMATALDRHAEEAFAKLKIPREMEIVERLFKALTHKEPGLQGIRRPTSAEMLCKLCQCSMEEMERVTQEFRRANCAFLLPGTEHILEPETVIDISHESLMRIWKRLAQWVEEEGESAALYKRLAASAGRKAEGSGGFWKEPELGLALKWQEEQQPTEAWALRYAPDFDKVMGFLSESSEKAKEEEILRDRARKAKLRAARRYALVISLISLGMLFFLWQSMEQRKKAFEQTKIAEKNASIAEEKTALVLEEKKLTEQAKLIAESKQKEAVMARIEADSNLSLVEKQKQISDFLGALARAEAENATLNAIWANREKLRADTMASIAVNKTKLAEIAKGNEEKLRQETERNWYLAEAENIAHKSHLTSDTRLKTLLALQAYRFYQRYDTTGDLNAIIYHALYKAKKALSGNDFNLYPGHQNEIKKIILTANQRFLLSVGGDGQLLLWNLRDEDRKPKLLFHGTAGIRTATVSPNDRWVAFPYPDHEGVILLQDLGLPLAVPLQLRGMREHLLSMLFLPDSRRIVTSSAEGTLRLWDRIDGKSSLLAEFGTAVQSMAIDPAGKRLALALNNGAVLLLDPMRPTVADTLAHPGSIAANALSFCPKGRRLAWARRDGVLVVYDLQRSKEEIRLSNSQAELNDVSFSPDGRFVMVAGNDGKAASWDLGRAYVPPLQLHDTEAHLFCAQFSPDGLAAWTGDEDGVLRRWPLSMSALTDGFCDQSNPRLKPSEWEFWMGKDIPFETTCQ